MLVSPAPCVQVLRLPPTKRQALGLCHDTRLQTSADRGSRSGLLQVTGAQLIVAPPPQHSASPQPILALHHGA